MPPPIACLWTTCTGDEAKASSVASGSDLEEATVSVSAEGEGDVRGGGPAGRWRQHRDATHVHWKATCSSGGSARARRASGGSGRRRCRYRGARIRGCDVRRGQFASIPSEFPDVDYAEWYAEGVSFCSAKRTYHRLCGRPRCRSVRRGQAPCDVRSSP